MNEYIAVLYGVIQGLTEFVPVSSSGHLALIPHLMKIKDPGLVFDLAMHIGTAAAVALYFHKEVKRLIINSFKLVMPNKKADIYTKNFIIATFFTGVGGLLLKNFAESYGRNGLFIAFNLGFFGLLLFLSDLKKESSQLEMEVAGSWKKAVVIGLSQILAIFPGVSRSGITLTVSRSMGLSKIEAASFSFLLSLPLIVAGAVLKFMEISNNGGQSNFLMCSIGIVVSFAVGLATIHYFLKLLKNIKFLYFMIYRFILSAFIFYFYI